MAILKLAAPVAGIRGTVAGLIYSANGSGPYVKAWAAPSNPRTETQTIERSILAQMPTLWRALTIFERALWDNFAALPAQELFNSLGESYFISGWLWFVKCNIRLLRVGRATITATPTVARPAAPTIDDFRVAVDGTESNVAVGGTPTAATTFPGQPPSNAFDGNTSTYWEGLPVGMPTWLEYSLPSSMIVREYQIWSDVPGFGVNPKDWTFEGFNGATWDVLDTQVGHVLLDAGWNHFHMVNETSYTRYRINISATKDPAAMRAFIWEMQFFEGLLNHSAIVYPSGTFTGPTTDLILHIAMTISEARRVQYPGYYEILALQNPADIGEQFQDELLRPFGTILGGRQWFAQLYRQTVEGIRSAAATANTVTIT